MGDTFLGMYINESEGEKTKIRISTHLKTIWFIFKGVVVAKVTVLNWLKNNKLRIIDNFCPSKNKMISDDFA